jgi:hypothetical protein
MRVSTQKIVQHQWLPLLMVLVLAAGIVMSPVSWMENQQQGIGLEAETESESSGDDKLMAGLLPDLMVNKSLSVSPVIPETLSSTGSDAYSSLTLHGPPVPNYPV